MQEVLRMLIDAEQELRAKKQYSAADKLVPIIKKAKEVVGEHDGN